ncbi:MAG TPA: RNA methyltransferase, partial [Ferruginibacter sp.]|nr:RNA methyltransferase [Ferruginibacter sp.]
VVRNEFLPHHELALATAMVPLFPYVELDKNAALDYLRKKDFGIIPAVKGWAMIKYRSLVLGFIKGLPGRVNNYYPKEWRILNK